MRVFWLWIAFILLSSCSPPRYTYYFAHPYPVPNKESSAATPRLIMLPAQDDLSTSMDKGHHSTAPGLSQKTHRSSQVSVYAPGNSARVARETQEISLRTPPSASPHMEPDLKRSIIFGIAGIVALIIGSQVFWVLGSLSLLIGLIFGIKWVLRQ